MKIQHKNKQTGATLIVCLIILAVMTVLGLSSIRSSNLELKMSASQRDHSIAFQAAESALKTIERQLALNPFSLDRHLRGCTGNNCFSSDCSNGLCFDGDFEAGQGLVLASCNMANPDTSVVKQFWQDANMWNAAQNIQVPKASNPNEDQDIQYLIEFMCFVPRDDLLGEDANDPTLPLYRITVRAEGEANRSNVTLQSVFQGRLDI